MWLYQGLGDMHTTRSVALSRRSHDLRPRPRPRGLLLYSALLKRGASDRQRFAPPPGMAKSVVPCPALYHIKTWRMSLVLGRGTGPPQRRWGNRHAERLEPRRIAPWSL